MIGTEYHTVKGSVTSDTVISSPAALVPPIRSFVRNGKAQVDWETEKAGGFGVSGYS